MTSTKLAFVVLAWAGTLRGQSSQISGVILDPSHSNVSGAHISLLNEQTGGRRNAQSNGLGYYSFPSLGPGIYRIVARAAGFETAVVEGIKLEVGENTQFDFNMRVGDFRTVLTVKADTQTMNTENASVGTVIDRNIIDQMPLNGRGIQSLIEFEPRHGGPASG